MSQADRSACLGADACARIRTHTHTNTNTRKRTHAHTHAHTTHTNANANTHTQHTRMYVHTCKYTCHPRANTPTPRQLSARLNTHAHTCARAQMRCGVLHVEDTCQILSTRARVLPADSGQPMAGADQVCRPCLSDKSGQGQCTTLCECSRSGQG